MLISVIQEVFLNSFFTLFISGLVISTPIYEPKNEYLKDYWRTQSAHDWNVQDALYRERIHERARNAVLFLGDGMGVSTVTAARYYKSQIKNEKMGNNRLFMETLAITGYLRTFSSDSIVTDSAASATAYLTGTKCKNGVVGYDYKAEYKNCESAQDAEEQISFLLKAKAKGFKTGFVTTTTVTHATPAALYAHSVDRNLENETLGNCPSIADQLADQIDSFDFVAGGGREHLLPKLNRMQKHMKSVNRKLLYVEEKNFTDSIKLMHDYDTVLALMSDSHLPYNIQRKSSDISLSDIVAVALKFLEEKSKNSPGFLLFVEGGRIDHGQHNNKPKLALSEALEFDKAIEETSQKLLSKKDTLIVVTADHSHGFTINSGSRTVNLFGVSDEQINIADDGKKFFNLLYASGPAGAVNEPRQEPEVDPEEKPDLQTAALVPIHYAFHGGEDVMVYASGPMSYLFNGVHDNTYIAHSIERALGIVDSVDYMSTANRIRNTFYLLAYVFILIFYYIY